MESYDIIANQPVVIDNVRPRKGEGGRPTPEVACGGAERDPSRLCLSILHCAFRRSRRAARFQARAKGPGVGKKSLETSLLKAPRSPCSKLSPSPGSPGELETAGAPVRLARGRFPSPSHLRMDHWAGFEPNPVA
jgi:hypothetical protein